MASERTMKTMGHSRTQRIESVGVKNIGVNTPSDFLRIESKLGGPSARQIAACRGVGGRLNAGEG